MFLGAGFYGISQKAQSPAAGFAFLLSIFLAVVFWGIGAIFIAIGRKAFIYESEDKED